MEAQLEATRNGSKPLESLEQTVRRAGEIVAALRRARHDLERRAQQLESRCAELERRLAEQPAQDKEVERLRAAERRWQGEKRDLAERIEALVAKLEHA